MHHKGNIDTRPYLQCAVYSTLAVAFVVRVNDISGCVLRVCTSFIRSQINNTEASNKCLRDKRFAKISQSNHIALIVIIDVVLCVYRGI